MPLDPLSPILPGDPGPIPASTWNRLLELLRRDTAQRAGRSGPGPLGDTVQGTTVVLVQNSTGSAASHGYCLAITDALLDPTASPPAWLARPALDGDTPAANDDPFVVLLEPIADGAVGRAAIAGLAIAQVDVTDTGHGYAAPTPSDATKLTSAASGPARILWKESGSTGTQACVLMLGDGGGGLSSGITVKESDGSPSYTSITSLEIDQTQGGVVTQPGTGRAKVSWADASTTQAGVVSTGTQTFGGAKSFNDDLAALSDLGVGGNCYLSGYCLSTSAGVASSYEFNAPGVNSNGRLVATTPGIGLDPVVYLEAYVTGNAWVTQFELNKEGVRLRTFVDTGLYPSFEILAIISGVLQTKTGQTTTVAGVDFTGGICTGGSFTGVTSVTGSGGTTGLTYSSSGTGAVTVTTSGTLVPANGGTGLTTTPADGTLLTGTGSGYAQTSALAFSSKWGVD